MKNIQQIAISLLLALFITQAGFSQSVYQLPDLPYEYHALEPYIDAQTMEIHHSKHHQGYVNNLNKAIGGTDTAKISLEEILKTISKYSTTIRNNAGGHYNHTLFWTILTPNKNTQPSKRFHQAIVAQFGSLDSVKTLLNSAAAKQFGSGWAWLSVDSNKKLFVSSTPNQDNPLMDISEKKGTPILGIDVWEHAYYLKYQNKRTDYLAAIWNVVNWEEISKRYEAAVPKGRFDDWQSLKDFHTVLSQTFHPGEEGNLEPIKTRIDEFVEKAKALNQSEIPSEFNNENVKTAVGNLYKQSQKLQKVINKKGTGEDITQNLNDVHDIFHEIIGLCTNDDH